MIFVRGQTPVAEIIESTADTVRLLFINGVESPVVTKAELAEAGFVPTLATKIIKGDGTWMYYAPSANPLNKTQTKWFTREGTYD